MQRPQPTDFQVLILYALLAEMSVFYFVKILKIGKWMYKHNFTVICKNSFTDDKIFNVTGAFFRP